MMRHTSRDRLGLRDSIDSVRQENDWVILRLPTLVTTTRDADTGGARDVSLGNGTGVTVTWQSVRVAAMVRDVDVSLVTFGHVPPGAQIGDVIVAIGMRDYDILSRVLKDENAYLVIYGDTYRPVGISREGVTRAEEYLVTARKYGALNLRFPGD